MKKKKRWVAFSVREAARRRVLCFFLRPCRVIINQTLSCSAHFPTILARHASHTQRDLRATTPRPFSFRAEAHLYPLLRRGKKCRKRARADNLLRCTNKQTPPPPWRAEYIELRRLSPEEAPALRSPRTNKISEQTKQCRGKNDRRERLGYVGETQLSIVIACPAGLGRLFVSNRQPRTVAFNGRRSSVERLLSPSGDWHRERLFCYGETARWKKRS